MNRLILIVIYFFIINDTIFCQNKIVNVPKYFYVSNITGSWQDSSLAKKYFGKKSILPEIKKLVPANHFSPDSNKFNIVFDFIEAKFSEKVKGPIINFDMLVKINLNYQTEKGIQKLNELELSSSGQMLASEKNVQLQKYWKKIIEYILDKTDYYLESGKNKLQLPYKPAHINVIYSPKERDNEDTLIYNPSRQLAIDDFKGNPDRLSKAGGATYSGIGLDYSITIKDFILQIELRATCVFHKDRSWLLNYAKRNPYILKHEQLHFDICYWQTMEFMEELKLKSYTLDNLKSVVEKAYKEKFKAYEKLQEQYDEDSDHGLIESEQIRWNQKVKEKIAEIEER
jgi:hypothetical protein